MVFKSHLVWAFFGAFALLSSAQTFAFGSRLSATAPAEPSADNRKIISDSLVQGLACSGISQDTVMASIRSNAFSTSRQLPVHNWASGMGLAECWSLTHFQRLVFYMGRFEQPVDQSSPDKLTKYLEQLSDDARGNNDDSPEVFPLSNTYDLYETMYSRVSSE